MKPHESTSPPLQIPYQTLSDEALQAVIESFILRDGTDYGSVEVDFEKKYSQILKKIKTEDYLITFDAESESVTLLTRDQWRQLQKGHPHEL